ncbi:MAG: thrombospondin type 3 repeat-containing protein, partial [bacterium]
MKKVGMTLAAIAATFFCLSEVFADCSASNQCFSQTPEDYSIVLSKEQNSDGYQVILYGRLAKNVDFASLSTFDSAWKGSEANFPHKESGLATLSGQRILPIMTLVLLQTGGSTTSKSFPLYSDCQLLHPKSAAAETSDKGEVFRCVSNQKLDESMLDGTDPLALSDPGTMCNIRTYDGTLKSSTPAIVTAKLISQFGKDADNDKVPDAIDNCPDVANFSQEANDDGTG